jgi:hypothetical protein
LARDRLDLLERAARWFEEHRAIFPPSPYGRFLHAALDCRVAAAGLRPPPSLGEDLLEFWDEAEGFPSAYAAMDSVIDAWLDAGDIDLARRAVERAAAWVGHPTMAAFYRPEVSLVRSRVLLATGQTETAAETARQALDAFRGLRSPWWIAKAIRGLEDAGAADQALLEVARSIEERLGLIGPAR